MCLRREADDSIRLDSPDSPPALVCATLRVARECEGGLRHLECSLAPRDSGGSLAAIYFPSSSHSLPLLFFLFGVVCDSKTEDQVSSQPPLQFAFAVAPHAFPLCL